MTKDEELHGESAALHEWFAEFCRLAAEAEARFMSGDLRQALSSLAAVPMIHSMLMQGCDELTSPIADPQKATSDEVSAGLYL